MNVLILMAYIIQIFMMIYFYQIQKINAYIVKNSNTKKIKIENNGSLNFELNQSSLKTNKIEKVSLMGEYLRVGDFENYQKLLVL